MNEATQLEIVQRRQQATLVAIRAAARAALRDRTPHQVQMNHGAFAVRGEPTGVAGRSACSVISQRA